MNYDLLRPKTIRGKKEIVKIPALDFLVTKDMRLTLKVRTFTSRKLAKKINFKNGKTFDSYARYVLEYNNTMRRKLTSDKDADDFILRQTHGTKKSEIKFMNTSSLTEFDKSKMGMLVRSVDMFNTKYQGVAHIGFKRLDITQARDYTRKDIKAWEATYKALLKDHKVRIIDRVQSSESEELVQKMVDAFYEKLEVKPVIGKNLRKDAYNVVVIHNEAYYEDAEDDYRIYDDVAVQHITVEDFRKHAKDAVKNILYEMMIKKDLIDGQIHLVDWASFNFRQDLKFGMKFGEDKNPEYVFMRIHPDGKFEFYEQKNDLFQNDAYVRLNDIFMDMGLKSTPIRVIVEDDQSRINIIRDTDYFTIPEIFQIRDILETNNFFSRGQTSKEENLSSVIDIKYIDKGDYALYFSGTIGNGMRSGIRNAVTIRRVEGYDGADIFFRDLLQLMAVEFVRAGQLTVLPFPFKYLREYYQFTEGNDYA